MIAAIKIGLSLLLFLCLFDMSYGFYQLVRFLAMVGFGFLAYNSYENKNQTTGVVYILLAVLFQPLFKISLGRNIWSIVDVVVALGLVISLMQDFSNSRKNTQ